MYSKISIAYLITFTSLASSHGVVTKAQGTSGSVASQGFLVNNALARNCTDISPCQQDATIIRDAEIKANIVNGCGRTELNGNIDIGEQTENELAANRVTTVTKGTVMEVTIHQVNADGAGPYTCDLDQTSNANTNFVPLNVTDNVPGTLGLSQAKEQDFVIKVALPTDMNCIGASTGNICTVRCRNNALAGPFGGCFAVQQTDGTGRTNSTPAGVDTAQTLGAVSAQIQVNQQDLDTAIKANQAAGAAGGSSGASAISLLASKVSSATSAATAATTATAATAATTTTAATQGNKGNGKGNKNNNNKRWVVVPFRG